ncbi:MAG: hypothetical protein C4523_01990 [Myxococcales bacterium]|nr:MAG: hypothetical protein C4523_01990 [Myxococcales bacterium]
MSDFRNRHQSLMSKTAKNDTWRLQTGEVVIDRSRSHLHDGVESLLPEALSRVQGGRSFIKETVDFERPIGETTCVPTLPNDIIIWAKRPNRFGHTRFVKNRAPEACSSMVVILKKAEDRPGTYVLISAFVGNGAEPEVWDRNATTRSREFWASHALVWGSEPTVQGTETVRCPW